MAPVPLSCSRRARSRALLSSSSGGDGDRPGVEYLGFTLFGILHSLLTTLILSPESGRTGFD